MYARLKRNYKKIVKSGLLFNLLRTIFFKTAYPTVVSWSLTNRCNQHCLYCRLWTKETPELETQKILNTINRLFSSGVHYVIFTGGEPLLRDDIEEILDYAHRKGMYVALNTNARLLKQKIGCLKNLEELRLSLDGPERINDYLKREGSFRCTVQAIELAKKRKIPASLTAVLSRDNLDWIDFLLTFAKEHKLKIGFQPASLTYLGADEPNPFSPTLSRYKRAISYLIKCKLKGNKCIINSITGLRHIYHFPDEKKLSCLVGKLMFRLQPNGNIVSCPWGLKKERQRIMKIEDIMDHIDLSINSCSSCWCYNAVEINLIGLFKFDPIVNAIKNLF